MASNVAPALIYLMMQGHSSFAIPCARDKFEFSDDLGCIWQGVMEQRRQGMNKQVEQVSWVPHPFKCFSLEMQAKMRRIFPLHHKQQPQLGHESQIKVVAFGSCDQERSCVIQDLLRQLQNDGNFMSKTQEILVSRQKMVMWKELQR